MRRLPRLIVGFVLLGTAGVLPSGAADPAEERFETKIRPILAEHCVKCHGPDKQSAGLRLDSRDALLKGGESEGSALKPGEPDASPLVQAVRHAGELKMPPTPRPKLPDAAARELADWVKAGAPWPEGSVPTAAKVAKVAEVHWSFRPVKKVEPPKSEAGTSPIDAFLDASIASHGLTPAPRADRRTLIRRATTDLTGLPPTSDEVDAFLADARPDREAFAAVVDRLLASPHYGERWGRLWLDVARYADTKGYVFQEETKYPYSYTYRDWVVEAFNEDLPYDKFVVQQVAADRLPNDDDNRHLAAMGFLTVGRRFLQDQNEIIDDRIDVVTRGLLGLSVTCARCHDHKFDPIPTDDYYSLYGVFASSEEPKELPLIRVPGGAKEAKDFEAKLAERKKAVEAFASEKKGTIQKELRSRFADYLVAAEAVDFNARTAKFDEVVKAGKLRPEVLRRLIVRWRERTNFDDPRLLPWKALSGLPAAEFKARSAAAIAGAKGKAPASLLAALTSKPIESRPEAARRYGDILARALADPPDKALTDLRQWLNGPDSPIAVADRDLRRILNPDDRNRLTMLERKVSQLEATHPGAPARAMVMVDKPSPVEPRIFLRGNPGRPGKAVPRQFLKVVSTSERKPFTKGSGRLELAESIVRKDNPLASRVMVNRIWMYHFGRGIVATPSDFGLRGDPPTHPELLDWLASTFVENGWSIKAMHRLLMDTDAYARSGAATPDQLRIDPVNSWLSHQNRRRLDFESMRDSLLASAGRLDPSVGGKPVPLEVAPYPTRRALYGFIDRYNLDPTYRTFDFPTPDASSPKRSTTIVPQQALYLLNSPFVAEQARHLAARPEVVSGSTDERIRGVYHLLFGRDPEPHEVALGHNYLEIQASSKVDDFSSPWRYGLGTLDASNRVDFHPLPHWTGQAWQVGPKLPDPKAGFANLSKAGGHPGPDPKRSLVLRWVAPADAAVAIAGTLHHPEKQGDGVRVRAIAGGKVLGSWEAHGAKVEMAVAKAEIKRGQAIDFVLDCRASDAFDSFEWSPLVRVVGPAPSGVHKTTWDARDDFHGPEAPPLSPWESYAQALLLTNEFLYVD